MKCPLHWCPAKVHTELPFCNRHWRALPRTLQRRIIAGFTPNRTLAAAKAALDIKAGLLPTERGYKALLYFGFDRGRLAQGVVAVRC